MASSFAVDDTIVAIATPPGRGGIGVVRVSGPAATRVAGAMVTRRTPFEPRRATLTFARRDRVVVTYFPGPHSYTGDDVVELSAHGSPVVLEGLVAAAVAAGARAARPGEFTLRAFLNGRMDLTQAEAVGDLIEAATPLQADAAFDQLHGTLSTAIGEIDAALLDLVVRLEASVDFPEEGYHFVAPEDVAAGIDEVRARVARLLGDARRGRLIREGLQVAVVGPPNAGKSRLFNALVGTGRAIVAITPGTTRDVVTETVNLGGLRVTLADTAGLHGTSDSVEAEGIRRSEAAAAVADAVLVVGDQARAEDLVVVTDLAGRFGSRAVLVANKADLPSAWSHPRAVAVSAATGYGLAQLEQRIAQALDVDGLNERPAMTNVRHIGLVERADASLARARAAVAADEALPEEFILADLHEARQSLEEVTGRRTADDVLNVIFGRFCIGK
jgi:tRNA modification GTPase